MNPSTPNLPEPSYVDSVLSSFERHPLGALLLILLVAVVALAIRAWNHRRIENIHDSTTRNTTSTSEYVQKGRLQYSDQHKVPARQTKKKAPKSLGVIVE